MKCFKHFILAAIFFLQLTAVQGQQKPLSVTMTPFLKSKGNDKLLCLAVSIRSSCPDSLVIDDSRFWIRCEEKFGVRLITEVLTGNCYTYTGGAHCDPVVTGGEVVTNQKSVCLQPGESYSYELEIFPVFRKEETGLKRTLVKSTPHRFRLELPYWLHQKEDSLVSGWVYYAYQQ